MVTKTKNDHLTKSLDIMNFSKFFRLSLMTFSTIFIVSCATELSFAPEEATGPEISVGDATQQYQNVDERLWSYLERFEKEAKLRDVYVDVRTIGLIGSFEVMPAGVTGTCTDDPDGKPYKHLTLNKDMWIAADKSTRELMVFHQLGRCVLGRAYNDDTTTNGICKSIMRSDVSVCIDNYNANTREIYLDELFNN